LIGRKFSVRAKMRYGEKRVKRMPNADDFTRELRALFYEAFKADQPTVQVSAGDLHRRVGDYPGNDHRMPVCCTAMKGEMDEQAGDVIVSSPPSGFGATFAVKYVLPRRQ